MIMMLAAAAASAATPAAIEPDIECLAIYTMATGIAKTDEERLPALMGTAYFYGRLEAVHPSIDVTAILRDESKALEAMSQPNVKALGERCDKQFQAMGERFTKASEALK